MLNHNFYNSNNQTKSVNAPNFMNLYASGGSNVFEEVNNNPSKTGANRFGSQANNRQSGHNRKSS